MRLESVKSFIRAYLLFMAISGGILVFCAFHFLSFLDPIKPLAHVVGDRALPILIFTMLFLTFSKLNLKEMMPRWWHLELLIFQAGVTALISLWLATHTDSDYFAAMEGAAICIICPTAAACGVITSKLGGNESAATTYIIISNLATAICIPLLFPLFTQAVSGTFFELFWMLMQKVFPVVVLPLILALSIKFTLKKLHHLILEKFGAASYYLWGTTLVIVSARTLASIVNSPESHATIWLLALVGLSCTALQFAVGKLCGQFERQRITAGQCLGQKNAVFALWVSFQFLSPVAAIAPGTYILWQNIVNGFQMVYREHRDKKYQAQNLPFPKE